MKKDLICDQNNYLTMFKGCIFKQTFVKKQFNEEYPVTLIDKKTSSSGLYPWDKKTLI